MRRLVISGSLLLAVACKDAQSVVTPPPPPPAVASVQVSPGTLPLVAGATGTLTATPKDAEGAALSGRTITWQTSNAAVATVTNGTVTAVAVGGPVTITAASEGVSGTAQVTVAAPPPAPVASVALDQSALSIPIGATGTLIATPKDANGNALAGRTIAWQTGNAAIATVTNGVVTAVAVGGPVAITATSEGKSATAQVTVTPPPVATVTLDQPLLLLPVGFVTPLVATLKDADGNVLAGRTVTWQTSNPAVATVVNGTVTAGAVGGPVTITASSEGKSASLQVTVRAAAKQTLAAGQTNACLISATAVLSCWGSNGSGQIGNAISANPQATPLAVSGGLQYAAVNVGSAAACALTTAGAAHCWGSNSFGQLGDGTGTSRNTPTPVSGGRTFASLAIGNNVFSCALEVDGTPWCWGGGSLGQVGDGTVMHRSVPTAVSGGLKFRMVAAATATACGITAAGATWCWGANPVGEWGDGGPAGGTRLVPAPSAAGLVFIQITAGFDHVCGLTAMGAVWCWGADNFGQMGNGTSTTAALSTPAQVGGGRSFVTIAAGGNSTCGVDVIGLTYCWGSNLGAAGFVTTPTVLPGGPAFTQLAMGANFICGAAADGVYCWGSNLFGQLGNGTVGGQTPIPFKVTGTP